MIQLQVLNKILKDNAGYLIIENDLKSDFFSDYPDEFKFIYDYMLQYNYEVPSLVSFKDKFNDFPILDNVDDNLDYLMKTLFEDRNHRLMAEMTRKLKQILQDSDDLDKVEKAEKLSAEYVEKMRDTANVIHTTNILNDTSRYERFLEKMKYQKQFFVTTGFPELDNVIGGWDRKEELATIVARTNYGKSWILLKCAAEAAKAGLKVGIYSGEMSEDKVAYRIDTLAGHVKNGSLIHGDVTIQEEYEKYIKNLKNIFHNDIIVLTPKGCHGPAKVSTLRTFIKKEKLDILFVDQHSLLADDRGAKNPIERASNISMDLKNLQVMEQIPIIAVSQQNRTKNEDGSVDNTQISQSDKIGQDSTIILFIVKEEDVMKIYLTKSRDSQNNIKFTYNVDLNTGTFNYIPEEDSNYEAPVVSANNGSDVFE